MNAFTYMFKDRKVWSLFAIYFSLSILPFIYQYQTNTIIMLLIGLVHLFFCIVLYGYGLECIESIKIFKDNIVLPQYNIKKDFFVGLKLIFVILINVLYILIFLIIFPRINSYLIIPGLLFFILAIFLEPAQIFAISGNNDVFQFFNLKKIFNYIKNNFINYILNTIGLLFFNIMVSIITSKNFLDNLSLIIQTILSPYIMLVSVYFIANSIKYTLKDSNE